jgi:hypothetical protein
MSSKKIYTTVGMAEEVVQLLREEAKKDYRSVGVMLEKILRERYKLPWEREKEMPDADQP